MLNVIRHPYSFLGDMAFDPNGRMLGYGQVPEGEEPTWGAGMRSRSTNEGKQKSSDARTEQLQKLANIAGIKMDFEVLVQWQPVDSQRLMLWAARFGKQEAYMSALSRRHFEERKSASHQRRWPLPGPRRGRWL